MQITGVRVGEQPGYGRLEILTIDKLLGHHHRVVVESAKC
jgi:hypothetical protein